jgi:predicted DNA-binding transcriptional regulator AlpA
MTKETAVGTIFVPQPMDCETAAEPPSPTDYRPGIGHNNPPPDLPPVFVTYAELRGLGVKYSRKHLLDLMRRRLFPQARQMSANRVAWVRAEVLEHLATRPIARAALFQKKILADAEQPLEITRRRGAKW